MPLENYSKSIVSLVGQINSRLMTSLVYKKNKSNLFIYQITFELVTNEYRA